ncbi:MAG: hypothetical protein K1X83_09050 [Oligoflexia bacterium]|nr:hypothetical protein [Oligoflexia bacterium]
MRGLALGLILAVMLPSLSFGQAKKENLVDLASNQGVEKYNCYLAISPTKQNRVFTELANDGSNALRFETVDVVNRKTTNYSDSSIQSTARMAIEVSETGPGNSINVAYVTQRASDWVFKFSTDSGASFQDITSRFNPGSTAPYTQIMLDSFGFGGTYTSPMKFAANGKLFVFYFLHKAGVENYKRKLFLNVLDTQGMPLSGFPKPVTPEAFGEGSNSIGSYISAASTNTSVAAAYASRQWNGGSSYGSNSINGGIVVDATTNTVMQDVAIGFNPNSPENGSFLSPYSSGVVQGNLLSSDGTNLYYLSHGVPKYDSSRGMTEDNWEVRRFAPYGSGKYFPENYTPPGGEIYGNLGLLPNSLNTSAFMNYSADLGNSPSLGRLVHFSAVRVVSGASHRVDLIFNDGLEMDSVSYSPSFRRARFDPDLSFGTSGTVDVLQTVTDQGMQLLYPDGFVLFPQDGSSYQPVLGGVARSYCQLRGYGGASYGFVHSWAVE